MRDTLWHVLVFSWCAKSSIWSYLRSQDYWPWYLPDWPSGKMFGLKQGQNIWTWLKLTESWVDYWSLGIFFLSEAWNSRFCSTGTFLSSVGTFLSLPEATSVAKTACLDLKSNWPSGKMFGSKEVQHKEQKRSTWSGSMYKRSHLFTDAGHIVARSCLQLVCKVINQSEATSVAKTTCPDTYLTDLRERC